MVVMKGLVVVVHHLEHARGLHPNGNGSKGNAHVAVHSIVIDSRSVQGRSVALESSSGPEDASHHHENQKCQQEIEQNNGVAVATSHLAVNGNCCINVEYSVGRLLQVEGNQRRIQRLRPCNMQLLCSSRH